ncbi:HET-domain-containing protein [Cadophora sp. DSE1049]|nr:HET-domain-containing protein [Cadophora sp. DSE1049]
MPSDDDSRARRALRGLWSTARGLTAAIANPPPACSTCLDLARNQRVAHRDPDEGRRIEGYPTMSVFAQSAGPNLDGCPYCAVILVATYLQADFLIRENATVNVYFPMGEGLLINDTSWARAESVNLQVYTPLGQIPPWPTFGTSRRVSSDSGSQESIDRIKEWLTDCTTKHSECRESQSSLLPTRLIDVGDPAAGNPPRLIETTPGDSGAYVALSHCWGLNQTYRTLRPNLSAMKRGLTGFDMPGMPKTFKDAIILTRTLGFRYIWIDSLCIIQDDTKDWEVEASKMCDVYSNATLTIAAASAAGDREGFLGTRPHPRKSMVNTFPSHPDLVSNLEVRCQPKHNRTHPLLRRAWVLQERLLSKRLVFFENDELVWECRTKRTCECEGLDNYQNESWGSERPLSISHKFMQSSREEIYAWWKYYVLEEYSQLSITFGMDKLPALSGIATKVAQQTGDTYLAGLWKEDLCLGLLWSVEEARSNPPGRKFDWEHDYTKSAQVAAEYRAPSWSWASIDGKVTHHVREQFSKVPGRQQHMVFLEADVSLAGMDPCGKIDFGYLRVKCPTLAATINLKYDAKGTPQYRLSFSDSSVSLRYDQYETFQPDVPFAPIEYTNAQGSILRMVQRGERDTVYEMVDKVTVKLAFVVTTPNAEENIYRRYALALGPSGTVEGAWEKVGRWGYYNEEGKRDYFPGVEVEELVIV